MRRNRPEYSDGVMQKANDYIGHPREVDEGYEVAMCRTAYAEGYATAMENAMRFIEETKPEEKVEENNNEEDKRKEDKR